VRVPAHRFNLPDARAGSVARLATVPARVSAVLIPGSAGLIDANQRGPRVGPRTIRLPRPRSIAMFPALPHPALIARRVLACMALWVPLALASESGTTLLYVSNLPDINVRPGLAEVMGLIEELRAEGREVLVIHGGDSLAPSIMSAFDRGAHMIALLNNLDPVALIVAKREFAFGEDELTLRTFEAGFPMVSNNIHDPLSGGTLAGLQDSVTVEAGTRTLCITGSVSTELQDSFMPERVRTVDPIEATARVAKALRSQDCDLVLASFGVVNSRQETLLEDGLVDILIQAESKVPSKVVREPGIRIDLDASRPQVAMITLGGPAAGCRPCDARVIELTAVEADLHMAERVDAYRDKLVQILGVPVGRTKTPLDTRRLTVRTGEAAFGNLLADALRESVAADIAIVNSGGIRGDRLYAAGAELTRGDIQAELPFRNRVTLLEASGATLRSVLENALAGYESQTGAFPQVSGMSVRFDPQAAVGERVVSIEVGDAPLQDEQLYTLGTLDFLARGGDGYEGLARARVLRSSLNALMWETVRSYIERRKVVAPRIEGRLINVRN